MLQTCLKKADDNVISKRPIHPKKSEMKAMIIGLAHSSKPKVFSQKKCQQTGSLEINCLELLNTYRTAATGRHPATFPRGKMYLNIEGNKLKTKIARQENRQIQVIYTLNIKVMHDATLLYHEVKCTRISRETNQETKIAR